MKRKEKPIPTFELFEALCLESYAFLFEHGFDRAPLPQREFMNQFQMRFTNGKVVVVIKGIFYGGGAETYFEDTAGIRANPSDWVPPDQRKVHPKPLPNEPQPLVEVRSAAQKIKEHCADHLRGEMERFYEFAKERRRPW